VEHILNTLARDENSQAVRTLAQSFGVPPEKARATIEKVVPELSRELERLTLSRGGVAGLVEALGEADYRQFIDRPELARDPAAREAGDHLLEQIFGTKHKSRVVAERAARDTALDPATIRQMLPVIAGMFTGGLQKEALPSLQQAVNSSPAFKGLGFNSRDPFSGQSPLPMPGEISGRGGAARRANNPYGDLSDSLRRQGGRVSQNGSLANIIRSILGSVLGFQSNGLMSWILRMIVMRYGWSILRFIVSRLFTVR